MEALWITVLVAAVGMMVWLRTRTSRVEIESARLAERSESLQQEVVRLRADLAEAARKSEALLVQLDAVSDERAALAARLEAERGSAAEKIALLQDARSQLSDQFKALAAEILEEKSRRFAEQNQESLGQLLEPLKQRLQQFQGKVEEVYVQEGKDRSALAAQVQQLMELNRRLSTDAHNLTTALKGQTKTQGNWGELILERLLETAGLRPGHEFDTQESHQRADGTRAQPDVVLHLPEDRHLVIDAKMSLVAYEQYVNADSDAAREAALRRHLDSVRGHVKELSAKNYQQLYELKSLDFVLMFIPVEPAFLLALANDGELWQEAWQRNVLLVSPSTLLFVVRTVAHLWRQEQQSRNAQEIARRGAELYDKLAGFVADLENVGTRLRQAQEAYDGAHGKLASGRGNVIRQAELLRELGVKPSKTLHAGLVESAGDEGSGAA